MEVLTDSFSMLRFIWNLLRTEQDINTIREFNERDLKWGAIKNFWLHPIKDAITDDKKQLVKSFENKEMDYLMDKIKTGFYGFPMEKLYSGYYSIDGFITAADIKNLHVNHKTP